MTRRALLALTAALGACGGAAAPELPSAAARVPGGAIAVAFGPDVERLAAVLPDLTSLGLDVRRDVAGALYVLAVPALPSGWDDLAQSRPFHDAWASRPAAAPDGSFIYCDLQAAVDHALQRMLELEPRAQALVEPLGLAALQWAIAVVRRPADGPVEIDGLVRASATETGLVAMLGGPAAASLLGAPDPDERLRIEIRFDPDVAHRTIEGWLAAEEGGGSLSVRNAMLEALAVIWRRLVNQSDGRATFVVDAGGRLALAAGLRAPDDTRDELDRLLTPGDVDDTWRAPGGNRVVVDGDRLVIVPAGAEVPARGRVPVDGALVADFASPDGPRGRVEVRRRDARTLAVRARFD